MVNSMAGLTTSRLFVTFLYNLALHFNTLASIKCSSDWIKSVITPPPELTTNNNDDDDDDDEFSWESAMVPQLESRVDSLWSYKKQSILHAYNIVNLNTRGYVVDNFRTCHDPAMLGHYQGLRCHVFQSYFKSDSNSILQFKEFVYSDFPISKNLVKAKSRKKKNNVANKMDTIYSPTTIPFIARPDLPVITENHTTLTTPAANPSTIPKPGPSQSNSSFDAINSYNIVYHLCFT